MPAVTTTEVSIVEYLADKGVRTWRARGDEVTAWCFFCGRHQRDKGRLYINTDEGIYYCQVCQESGNFANIQRHFGDEPTKVKQVGDERVWRRRILDAAAEHVQTRLENQDEVLLWLLGNDRSQKQRGLSPATIEFFKLGFIGKGWGLVRDLPVPDAHNHLVGTGLVYNEDVIDNGKLIHRKNEEFFKGPKVIIPYFSSGHCVQVRGRDYATNGRYYTGPDEKVRLFNSDSLRGATEVVICEGEFDTMVLWQALQMSTVDRWREVAVVGLPGAGAFTNDMASYFSDVRRIWLALDPDEAGRKASHKIKEILGPRCRIVELPDDLPKCDWTEYLVYRDHTWRDAVALLEAAGAEQRLLATFSDALDSYLHREELHDVVPLGWNGIDSTIEGGGITMGSVAVVAAKTGAGKTLIACNVIQNHVLMGLKIPTLVVSLEMPRADIAERLVKIWRFYHPYAEYDEMRAAFDGYLGIYDRNRLQGKELLQLVDEYVESYGTTPKLIVVDHLNYYARWQRGSSAYDRASNAIMDLKEVAKEVDAAMMVPTQVNRIAKDGTPIEADQMRDAGVIEETTDYLLTAWRPDDALEAGSLAERTGKLQASLEKNRRGAKKQRFSLLTSLPSLSIVDPQSQWARTAALENEQFWRGKSYTEIRARYAQGQLQVV